ncbi:hypothetical protein MLD38_022546 [Melastoma candidum]|nr:hypothetical protein MLD38_022546 [Melastoma candidum]
MSEEIGFPPPNMDLITPEKCSGRRYSMGQTCLSMDGKKKVPHYLRASMGSCHDLCKYGRRQESETKPWSSESRRKMVEGKPPEKIVANDVVSAYRKSYLKVKPKPSSNGKIQLLDSSSGAKQKVLTSKKGTLGINEGKLKAALELKSSPAPTRLSNPGKTVKEQASAPFKASKFVSVKVAERETLAKLATPSQIKAAITESTLSSRSPPSLGLRKYRDVVQNTRIADRIRVKDAVISSTSSISAKSSVGSAQASIKGQVQTQKTVIRQRNEKADEEHGIQQIEEEAREKTLYVVEMENDKSMNFNESSIDVEVKSASQSLSNSEFFAQQNSSAVFSCSEERAESEKSPVHSEEREETENSLFPSEERDETEKSYVHSEEREETENSHVHSEERDETEEFRVHSEEREETEKSHFHSVEREEAEKSHVYWEEMEETEKFPSHSEEREEMKNSRVHSEEGEEMEKSHVHSEAREGMEKSHVHSEEREGMEMPQFQSSSCEEDDDEQGSEYLDDELEVCSNTVLGENENPEDVFSNGDSVKRRPRKEWMVHPEGVDLDPVKLRFRRGRVIEIQSEDNAPRRLKFRRGRSLAENETRAGTQQRRSQKKRDIMVGNDDEPSSEKHMPRNSGVQERKDVQGLFNNVIEETASKLVETRKSKVMALVGAFETVISLQDGKPSTTDEAI